MPWHAKSEIKLKADCRAVDAPKKWMNKFVVVFAVKKKKEKRKLSVRFLGESTARHANMLTVLSDLYSMKIQLQKGLDPNVLSTMTKDKWDAFAMDKAISVSFPAFLFTLSVCTYISPILQLLQLLLCNN